MAHADPFPSDVLGTVAAELGHQLCTIGAPTDQGGTVEIRETFAVWFLGADAVTNASVDIAELAVSPGQWHHQIWWDRQAKAFARSVPLGPAPTDWRVTALFESDIAKSVQEAIQWVDANVNGDPLVRLLVCPAFYLHAFWLFGQEGSQILIVDMPADFVYLKGQTLYSSGEFLRNLANENYSPGSD